MFRSFAVSIALHGLLTLGLIVFSLLSPPIRRLTPTIGVRMIPMAAAGGSLAAPDPNPALATLEPVTAPEPPPAATPAPPPPPTPAPAATPAPAPVATPAPKKEMKSAKEIVDETKDIVEATPTATPEATPEPTPEATPMPAASPKATATPKATPAGTPAPRSTPMPRPSATPAGTAPAVPTAAMQGVKPPAGNTPPAGAPAVPSALTGKGAGGIGLVGTAAMGGLVAEMGENYFGRVLFTLQQNFRPPHTMPGMTCEVQFRILKDGEIRDPKILRSSGRADLDESALRALRDTARLPALYDDYDDPFVEVVVTFDFQKQQ